MAGGFTRLVASGGPLFLAATLGCGPRHEPARAGTALETIPIIITEVAQATPHEGSTGDKVEVYCASTAGCGAFKVCDPSPAGVSCSALQPAFGSGQRVVVSRGASITTSDQVWLSDSAGNELAHTRVGPFNCPNGQSQSRADCSGASFGACGMPNLGASSGGCAAGDVREPFAYSLRFTMNQHGTPEATCNRPMCQELLSAIDGAKTSIDFAIYGIRAQEHIINALVAAQSRGVVVRGVVDTENSGCTKFGYADSPRLIGALGPSNVKCDTGPGVSYIMHDKFFVFDRKKVWTGSTNISDTELGGEYNSDVAVMFSSEKLAQIYAAEFEEMFGGLFHKRKADNTEHVIDAAHLTDGTAMKSYFSPTDHARDNAVIPLIDGATRTLDIAMFFFTSQEIAQAVLSARSRGVTVRMIIDAGGAANPSTKHSLLCAHDIAVKTENWGGKSHSKWAVADAGLSGAAAVVFGSMNWTGAGDENNDENTLYVRNDDFAARFEAEFERQWADLARVPACTKVSAEGADSSVCTPSNDCSKSCSSGSCCDGIDNDYDGKIDLEDEACACADGIDNDGDGYIDKDDWECRSIIEPE